MDVDLRWVGGIMYKNSEIEETGVAAGVLGHPALGVAWLANKLGCIGTALEPGHIVLAGSFTRVVFAEEGRHAARRFRRRSAASRSSSCETQSWTDMPRNAFKHAIAAGKLQIGLWCSLCSNVAAEIVSDSGFDWLLLDTEHSPNEMPDLLSQLQALARGTATPIVRPAWNDMVLIKRILDIGAQTLLLPYVQNAEEARARSPRRAIRRRACAASRSPRAPAATAGCRLSDQGQRRDLRAGAGRDRAGAARDRGDRHGRRRRWRVHRAVRSRGVVRPSRQPQHPEVQAAIEDAVRRLKTIGKPAGILTGNEDEARRYIDWGYLFVAVGADVGLLARNADALAKKFKG